MRRHEASQKTLILRPETYRSSQQKRSSVEQQPPKLTERISKELNLAGYNQSLKTNESKKNLIVPQSFQSNKQVVQPQSRGVSASYNSNKENDARAGNRIEIVDYSTNTYRYHKDNLSKASNGNQFKLYTEPDQENTHGVLISSHNAIIKSLKDKIARLEIQLTHRINQQGLMRFFSAANSSKQHSHIDIYLELMDFEKKCTEMKSAMDEQKKVIARLSKEIEENTNAHTQEIGKFNQAIEKLKVRLYQSKHNQSTNQSEHKYQQLKTLYDELSKSRTQINKKNQQLQEKLATQADQKRSLEDLVEKMSVRIAEAEQRYSEVTASLEEMVGDKLANDQELRRLKAQVGSLQSQMAETKSRLHAQIASLNQKSGATEAQLKSQLVKLQAEKNQVQQTLKQLIESSKKKESQIIGDFKSHVSKLEKHISGKNIELNQKNTTILQLQNQLIQLNKELEILKKQLADTHGELDKQQSRWEILNTKKQSLQRYKVIAGVKEICSKIEKQLPADRPKINVPSTGDETQKAFQVLDLTLDQLLETVVKRQKKQLQASQLNMKSMEMEKDCLNESRQVEMKAKDSCISSLLKICSVSTVLEAKAQQLIQISEQIVRDCTNTKINTKQEILAQLEQESKRIENMLKLAERHSAIQKKEASTNTVSSTTEQNQPTTNFNSSTRVKTEYTQISSVRKSLGATRPVSIRKYYD